MPVIRPIIRESREGRRAPEVLGQAEGWLNSPPLELAWLRGRAVLLDFFDYTCANCLRTLPYLVEWWRRYQDRGLTIIGLHAPEFDIGAVPDNVRRGLERQGITYPVALDSHFRIWRAFRNNVWPRHFLLDREGVVVEDHSGEGGYRQTEAAIQGLLRQLDPEVANIPLMEPVRPQDRPEARILPQTPELYLGYQRGELPQGYRRNAVTDYQDTGAHLLNAAYLQGPWVAGPQSIRHARSTDTPEQDYLILEYLAQEVNLVLAGSPERAYRVHLRLDGVSVPERFAGQDVTREGEATYVKVDEPRMYRLIWGEYGAHALTLASGSDQFTAYAFTFGAWSLPAA